MFPNTLYDNVEVSSVCGRTLDFFGPQIFFSFLIYSTKQNHGIETIVNLPHRRRSDHLGPIPNLTHATEPRLINFRSPNLFPEGLAYDPFAQHFIVGSLGYRIIVSVSEAGVIDTLIFDPTVVPENLTVLGLALRYWSRAPNSTPSQPTTYAPANASSSLPSYQTTIADQVPSRTKSRLTSRGNAYVTNSGGNYIWKVNT
ncbi:hypothetical protein ACFX13_011175 [Malus domestica]